MNGERILYLLMFLLALSLPVSALMRRRVAAGSALKLGLIWLAIIAGLLLAVKALKLDQPRDRPIADPNRSISFT